MVSTQVSRSVRYLALDWVSPKAATRRCSRVVVSEMVAEDVHEVAAMSCQRGVSLYEVVSKVVCGSRSQGSASDSFTSSGVWCSSLSAIGKFWWRTSVGAVEL